MKRFGRDVLIIAVATAFSRVFGLFRDIVIADRFGAGTAYDAYVVAFFIPHFLRRLLAEGALALSFIPIYTQYLKEDRAEADQMASNVINLLLLVFPLVILTGVGLAPHYVPFLASGFSPAEQWLTVSLTRVIFPFIGFVGFAALAMGILNAHEHFFAPAFAPVFFNVGTISGALFLGSYFSRPIFGLAVGVLLGGAGQLFFQVPFVRRYGIKWSPALFPLHPGVRKAIRLMIPVIMGLVAAQVNVFVDNKLASHLAAGSISALQYGMRLFQLPLGLFAVAISTAILPRLSAHWTEELPEDFRATLRKGVTVSLFIILPAALGLWVLGTPIVELLFEHREFTSRDTVRTVRVLNFYLIGLLGYSFVHLFTRAFYSIQETLIPVLAGLGAVAVNVGLDLLLVGPMGVGGLAIATGASGLVNAAILIGSFRYRTEIRGFFPARDTVARILGCVLLMGGVVWALRSLGYNLSENEFLHVFLPVFGGVVSYFGFTVLFGLKEVLWGELLSDAT